jgi:hypothetical protein
MLFIKAFTLVGGMTPKQKWRLPRKKFSTPNFGY